MIQQIIKKQTISLINKILQSQSQTVTNNKNNKDKNHQIVNTNDISENYQNKQYTINQYIKHYNDRGIIKQDQKRILQILLNKYIQNQMNQFTLNNQQNHKRQQNHKEQSNGKGQQLDNIQQYDKRQQQRRQINNENNKRFSEDEGYVMLKSIKRSILQKQNQLNPNNNKKQLYNQDNKEQNNKYNRKQNTNNNNNNKDNKQINNDNKQNINNNNKQSYNQLQQNNNQFTSLSQQQHINNNKLSHSNINTSRLNNNNKNLKVKQIKQSSQLQLAKISIKLKKQKQFINKNINKIKKYNSTTNNNISSNITINLQPIYLQQEKISQQISNKLFHIYKLIYPTSLGNNKLVDNNNFDTKQQFKSTLNYHKILEIFIHSNIKLQIQHKLSLLRIIKKYSFNPNFIIQQQWSQIYKTIINTLPIKQIILQRLVKIKSNQKKYHPFILQTNINNNYNNNNNFNNNNNNLNKQNPSYNSQLNYTNLNNINNNLNLKNNKTQKQTYYRTRKIKTQTSLPQPRFTSLNNIDSTPIQYQSLHKIDYLPHNNSIRPIQSTIKHQPKTYNPNQYRSRHKKLLTDLSQVSIKNIKKDMKSQKMIGLIDTSNNQKQDRNIRENQNSKNNQLSYLKKAIKQKKISKLTWQSLFEMKQDTMHHNIIIPQFAKYLIHQQQNY